MEGLYSYLFDTTEGRVVLLFVAAAVVLFYIVRRWRGASAYAEGRAEAF